MSRWYLLAVVGICTGCTVGPDFEVPSTPPADWAGSDRSVSSAAEYDLEWWQKFGDPTLDRLVAEVVASFQAGPYNSAQKEAAPMQVPPVQ